MGAFDRPDGSPESLQAASAALRLLATQAAESQDLVRTEVGKAEDTWTGARSTEFSTAGTGVQVRLAGVATATNELANAVSDLRTKLERTIDDVADCRARADRARSQAHVETAHLPDDDPRRDEAFAAADRLSDHCAELALAAKLDYARAASTIAERIDAITDLAVPGGHSLTPDQLVSRVDAATGVSGFGSVSSLARAWAAVAEWVSATPSLTSADGTFDPKQLVPWLAAGQTPAQAAAWWRGLAAEEQLVLIRTRSGLIGNIDGLPGWARDLANREQIPFLRARLEDERDEALAAARRPYTGYDGAFIVESSDANRLEGKLKALDVIEKTLQRGHRQLLELDADTGWELHAALAVGDVDTATNVAVFTPGLDASVQTNLASYDSDLADLQQRANKDTARRRWSQTTAAVAWMGYDAPQLHDVLLGGRSVASAHLSRQGGDRLATFYTGLNASRQDDPHLVALGHSYGSTTTGYALQHSGTGVDDVAFFGSPGLGTSELADLHVPAGHVYDLAAEGDVIAQTAWFGQVPYLMAGIRQLSTDANSGLGTTDSRGHSEYLKPSSTSQQNLAAVTTGKPTVPGPSHHEDDLDFSSSHIGP